MCLYLNFSIKCKTKNAVLEWTLGLESSFALHLPNITLHDEIINSKFFSPALPNITLHDEIINSKIFSPALPFIKKCCPLTKHTKWKEDKLIFLFVTKCKCLHVDALQSEEGSSPLHTEGRCYEHRCSKAEGFLEVKAGVNGTWVPCPFDLSVQVRYLSIIDLI